VGRAQKIAITVDADLLREAERLRRRTDESRSALFARALRGLLRKKELEEKIARYINAYREHPEAPGEIAASDKAAVTALRDLPWEDDE